MAAAHLNISSSTFQCFFTASSSLPSSSVRFPHLAFSSSFSLRPITSKVFRLLAVAEEEPLSVVVEEKAEEEEKEKKKTSPSDSGGDSPKPSKIKPCQLYVCNLPRSIDIPQLHDMFKPFGNVQLVEISRNAETGISKGCGYVTMSTSTEGLTAVVALDGIDVGGREMRVKFSEEMNKKKNIEVLDAAKNKSLIFETPHKIYVGNLPWSVKPEFLREYFSQYGNVVSVRVLYDRKAGRNRVYAFLSFSQDEALQAALLANGTELLGRKMVIRAAMKGTEPK